MTIKKGIRYTGLKPVLYSLYLFFIIFFLLEILLRIYNPFVFRLKGDRIILPVNQQQIIRNKINPRLDSLITNSRNSIGFRGDDPPSDFQNYFKVITVGGSTTECHFLNNDKTWPYLLGEMLKKKFGKIWLNNAGLDGHSSFGHQLLLNDRLLQLHPKVIVFLIGINDMENDGLTFHDKLNVRGQFPDLVHYLYNESEVINLAVNLSRGLRAQKFNNTTQYLKLPGDEGELIVGEKDEQNRMNKQVKYLDAYERRLKALIDTCKRNHILPVFMSQPTVYGEGIDSVTKINLATAAVGDGMNGKLFWKMLKLYNDRMEKVCNKTKVPFIDLAGNMPKNSWYYYDQTHFTNEGATVVSGIVAGELSEIMRNDFQLHRIGPN